VQRIEVVRGTGTLVFGPQMVGGTINFVTPGPPTHETWSLRALAGYPLLLGVSGIYGNRVGNASFLLGAVRRQGDGPHHDPFEVTEVLGRFRLEMGARSDLTARVEVFDQGANLSAVGLTTPMFESPTYRTLGLTPNDWTRLRRYAAALVHEFRIADNIRLRTMLHGAAYERYAWQQQYDRVPVDSLWYARVTGPTGTPGGALYFRDSNASQADSHQVVGLEPRLQAGFRLASFRNELDIGGRVQFERAEIESRLGSSQFARTGDSRFAELHEGFGVAAYVSDHLYFTDAWQLTAAVRFESFSFSAVTRRIGGMDVSARGTSSNIGLLPGGTLAFVQPNFTIFAGAHGGWIPTRFDQALEPTRGMITLEPETSVNSEAGARVQVADALHGELTGFWIERFRPIVPVTRSDGSVGWGNGNPARHLGVEALVQLDIGRLARVATNVYVNATYQFVDARVETIEMIDHMTCPACSNDNAGHMLPYVAPHTLTATLGVEHPIGFGAQASYRFVSDRFSDLANTTTPTVDGRVGVLPAFHGLDLSARYTHPETGLGITIGAKNVLDMQYVSSRVLDGIQVGGYRQLFVAIRWDR
jgi:Fe(3+) dicitrate transport protein